MTRVRLPVRVRKEADPVAEQRGKVQHFRLGCSVQELERDLADMLAVIRLTTSGSGISRELWLCSPRYALRFFRVLDSGLVELNREGVGLDA